MVLGFQKIVFEAACNSRLAGCNVICSCDHSFGEFSVFISLDNKTRFFIISSSGPLEIVDFGSIVVELAHEVCSTNPIDIKLKHVTIMKLVVDFCLLDQVYCGPSELNEMLFKMAQHLLFSAELLDLYFF